jgi:glycine/D-amino acid oxidase-like deaminating enzyme
VLDALPTTLDPAALATSLQQAVLNRSGVTVENISVPSEVSSTGGGAAIDTSSTPQEAKFTFVASGSYSQMRTLVHDLERTIRPIKVTGITLNGTDASLRATFDATTYYQPAKSAEVKQETIK